MQASGLLPGYRYLTFFTMFFMCIMICNAVLTDRYVSLTEDIFVLGGTLTSPLVFILTDIVAEIFGYKVARQMVYSGFVCQMIFASICWCVIKAPFPAFFKADDAYGLIFGPLIFIVMSSLIAFVVSSLVNIHIITKWKILLRGKYFWLRSLGSSTIAEGLYSAIAILMMEINSIPLVKIWKLILISYLIKVIYSVLFAAPANLLVNFIKISTKIDIYDA